MAYNFSTLNVRGITKKYAKTQLHKDLESYNIDIAAIQETKMRGTIEYFSLDTRGSSPAYDVYLANDEKDMQHNHDLCGFKRLVKDNLNSN